MLMEVSPKPTLGLGSWYVLNKCLQMVEGVRERERGKRNVTMAASLTRLEKVLWDDYAHLTRGLFLKGFYNSSVSKVVSKYLLDAIKCHCVNCQESPSVA